MQKAVMRQPSRRTLLAAALTPAFVPAVAKAEPKVIVTPFAMPRDQPYMFVGINGQGPFRFLMDTGDAAGAGISVELGAKLHLTDAAGMTVVGVVGKGDEVVYVVNDLNIGGTMRQRNIAISGIPVLHGGRAGALDGILPAHLFMSKDCDIDFAKHEVRLYLEGSPDRTGFAPVPYVPQNNFRIRVASKLADEPVRMIVDTGAACAINLSPHAVRRRGLWNAFPKFMETRAVGVTGGAAARLVKMPSVTFGPYRFHDVVVQLTDPEADDEDHDSDGLIGIDILRRFTLSIAANEAKLWLKPNDALGDPFRYNRAGLGVGITEHKAVVDNVTPGGPAEKAGLRIGDRLPEIKNRAFLDAFYWELCGAPGSQIDVQVDRPGGPQTLRLVLEDPALAPLRLSPPRGVQDFHK